MLVSIERVRTGGEGVYQPMLLYWTGSPRSNWPSTSEPRALILKVGIGTNVSSVVVVSYVVVASADVVISAVAVVSAVVVRISVVAVSVASVEVLSSSVDVALIDNSTEAVVVVTMSILIVETATDSVEVPDAGSVDSLPEHKSVNNLMLHNKV